MDYRKSFRCHSESVGRRIFSMQPSQILLSSRLWPDSLRMTEPSNWRSEDLRYIKFPISLKSPVYPEKSWQCRRRLLLRLSVWIELCPSLLPLLLRHGPFFCRAEQKDPPPLQ